MTNREKFKEVYGFELDGNPCAAPQSICNEQTCERCPFWGWWDKEYKSCFRYKEKKKGKAMTRIECEQAIMEKLGEIRKIYEEFDPAKTPEGVSIGMHLSYTSEEMADEEGLFKVGWYASVTCFVTDANDDTHYILNAFANDGEMYETDTRTLVKGVEI